MNANVTVNGSAVTGTNIGFSQDNLWDSATLNLDWLSSRGQAPANETARSTDGTLDPQASSERTAAVDQVFAQLVDQTDDFSDFGDN